MANEFIIKNGFISQGNSYVNATLSANTVQILTTPTLNNSNIQVLSRNSSTGAIEYSVISGVTSDNYVTGGTYSSGILTLDRQNGSVTITGLTSNDTYVTGFTYNNQNKLTLSQNQGKSDLTLYINQFSGLTVNGDLNVTGLTQTKGITSTGGVTFKQVTINSTYTATTEDYMIDVSGGTFTVYLPSAVGIQGRLLAVKNNGGGAVTVQPISGQTIDDKLFVILGETNSLQLSSNGSDWVILGYTISTVNSSTGVFEFTGLTKVTNTTFSVAPVKGWIVDDATNPLSPQLYYIDYSGGTHTDNYVTTANETFVYLTSSLTIGQQTTLLTEQQRRQNIFLGKLGHPDKTSINLVFSQPDFVLSPLSQLRDMFVPINLINGGVVPSTNGTNLKFNTNANYIYGLGINFTNNALQPNAVFVAGTNPCTFQYRTQTGGTITNVTDIDPLNYDVGGIVTPIIGTKATNQRIYLLQNGTIRVMYGQAVYNTLALAVESLQTETFTPFPNFINNAILIGILTILSTATNLTDTSKAKFFFASKFGETVGSAGGTSTTNLQQAYNNSTSPEIITNSILDGVQIRGGTGNDTDKNIIIESNAGVQTAWITASGDSVFHSVSATTYYNLPIDPDNYVTGGTYSNGTLTLNRQNGSVSVTGLAFTGNTSASCITDLYITNLYGCSPITINDSIQSNTSQATGTTSFGFGYIVSALGDYSHAEGEQCYAIGNYSHAEGSLSESIGVGSHAEGSITHAIGDFSHSEGNENYAIGVGSHTEGSSTETGVRFGFLSSVSAGTITLDTSYGDVTLVFNNGEYLFLSDIDYGNLIGSGSFLISSSSYVGAQTEVYLVDTSVTTTTALTTGSLNNPPSLWFGYGGDMLIKGDYSHAEGNNSYSIGYYSHAEGTESKSIGGSSHAEGRGSTTLGSWSHAEGLSTKSIGIYSHSQGIGTQSIGFGSFSSGDNSISSGYTSFIHSTNSLVTGDRSVVLGGEYITGSTNDTVYVSNFNIFNTPITNNSGIDLLVRDSNGDIGVRNFNTINYTPNLVTVSLTGGSSDFTSIKLAVDSITGNSSTNPYIVSVGPGVYYEDPITMKSYVSIVGDNSIGTIIQANNPNNTLITGADQSMVQDFQIQGCTGTGVSAIVYSSSTVPQLNAIFYVENVRFGSNYTHVKNVGTGGGNSIIQCSNVKYGGYPFTLGFHATNDGSGVGRIQLRNVTSTNGGVTTTSDLVFAKADKPNCAFIVNGCLLTKAVGSPAGTGFWVENGGSLRLTGVNFQRWVTGIYAPQSGSSPSIDAIALNFEGCTTDVNIVHSGATGKIQGTDNYTKTLINIDAPLYEVNQDPRVISVAKKGGDFSSVKSAVDSITTSSISNRFVVEVGPGQFYENTIDLTGKPYISIVGSNIQTTEIFPNTSTQHIIKIGINNEISFLSLNGAGSGYAGIYCYDIGDFAQAHKVSFYDCDINVLVESNTQDTKFYGEYLDFNGEYSYGIKSIGNNGYLALANMENYFNFPTGTGITICNYATGTGATINTFIGDNVSNGVSGSTAFLIQDSSSLNASTITIDSFTYGIRNPNIGNPVTFDIDNASIVGCDLDLSVERVGTFGTFGGSSSNQKFYSISEDVYWNFLDIDDGEFEITRKASVTFADGTHTDFTTLIFEGSTMGLMEGGELTIVSGFTVSTATGFGYLAKTLTPEVIKRIDWVDSQITLGTNENKYIYFNENGILSSSGTRPSSVYNIILGRVVTNSTEVSFIDLSPAHSDHTSNRFGNLFREAMGPIYASGSIVTENTTPFNLDVTGGEYYYSTSGYMPSGGTQVLFTQYYRDGLGDWITTATTVVNNTSYDGNGVLSGLTSGYYTKHTLYVVGDGSYENYFLVLGQNEYSSLVLVEGALLPTPPTFFTDSVSQVANIYIKQGTTGITQVEDIRPVIGFKAGGVNASSVHGNLLGLGADDHTQYLLVSGSRAMSGNLNMGSNNITTVGTVDGVTVSAHATRHQFGGLDSVGTTTPSANAIPYADINGKLDGWISDSSTSTKGLVTLSTAPTSPTSPIALSVTDNKILKSITGITYSLNVLSATTVDGTVRTTTIGLKTKASSVAGTSFTGNPKKYTVTFTTPYPNTNYSVSISANVNRAFTWETKTVNGFIINANSNTSFTENVDWVTTQHGES